MSRNKTKKGITLISLVITIILLLILATVAISLAVDSDGLFSKAGDAVNTWNTSVAEERRINELLNYDSPVKSYVTETSEVAGVKKERTAPIPKGYVASEATGENTIACGLVIYETETVVNDTNHDDAEKYYNQYVWIPVDEINDMVMCKKHGAKSQLDITTLECQICKNENIETILAGKIYVDNSTGIFDDDATEQIYSEEVVREPSDLTRSDGHEVGIRGIKSILGNTTATTYDEVKKDWNELLQEDFRKMAISVAKYKGFYISRYEVGIDIGSKKGQEILTDNYTDSTQNAWYDLFKKVRSNSKAFTYSQMIWGSQYDQVIKFIGEEAEIGHNDRDLASEPAESGNNAKDKMKNIYDLEGNYYEYTLEAINTNYRGLRGSNFLDIRNGKYNPASGRLGDTNYHPIFPFGCATSRMSLLI